MLSNKTRIQTKALLGAAVRWTFFAALFAAASSCTTTYQSEAHEPERAILESPCKPGAPIIGLAPAVDARPTQVIARYMEQTWFGYALRNPIPTLHEATNGTELADYASEALANCLNAKGYCVQRDQHSSRVPEPAQLVGVVLLSADTKNTSSLEIGSPLHRNRAADVKVEVRDSASSKVAYFNNYSSSDAMENPPFSRFLFGDLNAWYLREVNKAIDDAVKKACDDPALIAAIAPPSGTEPRPSSPMPTPSTPSGAPGGE